LRRLEQHSQRWSVAVVVPARDEQACIEPCIQRILQASATCRRRATVWVVVVADSCHDCTVGRARHALGRHGAVVECSVQSAGAARRLGTDAALAHFKHSDPAWTWLANTDADTLVPADWLARQLDFADQQVTALAGIVRIDAIPGYRPLFARRLFDCYEIALDGSHSHVHGANLGVRADAYLDAGGWSPLPLAEDHCLWRRVRSRGWRTRASASSVVVTSGRLQGRASGGFASTLCAKLAQWHE